MGDRQTEGQADEQPQTIKKIQRIFSFPETNSTTTTTLESEVMYEVVPAE